VALAEGNISDAKSFCSSAGNGDYPTYAGCMAGVVIAEYIEQQSAQASQPATTTTAGPSREESQLTKQIDDIEQKIQSTSEKYDSKLDEIIDKLVASLQQQHPELSRDEIQKLVRNELGM
jgi:flagellar capping protein FliD